MAANRAAPDEQPSDGDLVTEPADATDATDATDSPVDDVLDGDGDASTLVPATRHDPLARLEQVGAAPAPAPRRRIDVKLLLASLGISLGLVLVVLGLMRSVTGTEEQNLPDAIESIDPVRNATQVPQQTRVFVDFQVGYEAVMIIDGVELPVVPLDDVGQVPQGLGNDSDSNDGEQIDIPPGAIWEPGNATLTFEPGPAQAIEAFSTGMHTVTVRYWRTEDGPERFRTFNWTFYAV